MFVLTNFNNVVVCISSNIIVDKNGQFMDDLRNVVYINSPELMLYETVDDKTIMVYKHCYTPDMGFYDNPNFESLSMRQDAELKELKTILEEQQQAIAELSIAVAETRGVENI